MEFAVMLLMTERQRKLRRRNLRRRRMWTAIRKDKIHLFKKFLNSPGWYSVEFHDGNMLHVAIKYRSMKVFQYLLSLPDFPLENVNRNGETPLMMAVTCRSLDLALKLINRGANIHTVLPDGTTLLMRYFQDNNNFDEDFVVYMFNLGANPSDCKDKNVVFEWLAVSKNSFLRDAVFLYTIDKHTRYAEMSLWTLLHLAHDKVDYFFDIIHAVDDIVCEDVHRHCADDCYKYLFDMDIKYLKVLLEEGHSAITKFLEEIQYGLPIDVVEECISEFLERRECIDVLHIMFQSDDDIRNCLMDCFDGVHYCLVDIPLSHQTEFFYLSLSFGFEVTEELLQEIYRKHGNQELFQMMMHMDIVMDVKYHSWDASYRSAMATLLFNFSIDVKYILHNSHLFCDLEDLLNFFVIPNVKCDDYIFMENAKNSPKIPSLQELARNSFRNYLIEKLGVNTSKRFYSLIRKLPIPEVYKKILTLQRPLYF